MNWAQAKWAFPKLKPNRDNDRDGVKNQFDCRPLNFKMQHKKFKVKHIDDDDEEVFKTKKAAIRDIESRSGFYIEEFDDGNENI